MRDNKKDQKAENRETLKSQAKEKIRENNYWVEIAGRFGYSARGIVYILIGILAISGAVGAQNVDIDSQSALERIIALPFGQILLITVIIGLICHAFWRFIQAFMDTDKKGSDRKGYFIRTIYFLIGIVYLGLSFSAVKILLGISATSEFWAKSWTALILAQPFGQILVAIIGTIIVGIGFYQFYRSFSTGFREQLIGRIDSEVKSIGIFIGRYGLLARGIVFTLIGVFFVFAAWSSNAGKTKDFGSSLYFIERQPFGFWLFIVLAIGLLSYGIFMFFLSRYRKMVKN